MTLDQSNLLHRNVAKTKYLGMEPYMFLSVRVTVRVNTIVHYEVSSDFSTGLS